MSSFNYVIITDRKVQTNSKEYNMQKSFFQYGHKVPEYEVLVLNEREVRASAGIFHL